jgi:hypothetical protein
MYGLGISDGKKGNIKMEETIKKVEEVKKEADKLMINKIAKYERQNNILSITVKKLGEFLANAKKTIKERDDSMVELLEQENGHQKLNGKMQLRITELEQEVLETQADNKKQANQINDYIDKIHKMNLKVDQLRKDGVL